MIELPPSERRVLVAMVRHAESPDKVIAQHLGISHQTLRVFKTNIRRRLHMLPVATKSRRERHWALVRWAIEHGITGEAP